MSNASMFHGKTILITGGTGSWGQHLTRQLLLRQPKTVRIFSRNEFAQVTMERQFIDQRLQFYIGDVRDHDAVYEACCDVDYVFHLAALKHVPVCEFQPGEALKTNVTGTENVIKASIAQGVHKVIDVSTDKAVDPINFYGMTKAFGEKLMIRANTLSNDTRFVCIRGGNVLGTNGSVVPFFKQQIQSGTDVTVTSLAMTRFFLTISDAITLLLNAAEVSIGGETFVMKMPACSIQDLAEVLIDRLAIAPVRVREVGIRPGEKIHEVLVSASESPMTRRYGDQYYVILPNDASQELMDRYGHLEPVNFTKYQSNDALMTRHEIAELLVRGGMLP